MWTFTKVPNSEFFALTIAIKRWHFQSILNLPLFFLMKRKSKQKEDTPPLEKNELYEIPGVKLFMIQSYPSPPLACHAPFFKAVLTPLPPPSAAKTTPSSAKIQEFPPLTITMLLTHSLAELCKISSSCSLRKEKCYYSLWKKVNKKVNKTDAYLLKTWCYNF